MKSRSNEEVSFVLRLHILHIRSFTFAVFYRSKIDKNPLNCRKSISIVFTTQYYTVLHKLIAAIGKFVLTMTSLDASRKTYERIFVPKRTADRVASSGSYIYYVTWIHKQDRIASRVWKELDYRVIRGTHIKSSYEPPNIA
ncbi:hypothetical protein ANN_26153 [Periplaneta americana]|uniref:Uncharacterized protein n=1 Tax=Periplaneta americana TaxID=6978 RepID=A0ABQ8S5X7_PERAM|nr:hypothetical protein ANN_26153 [Periplaneta americana]